MADASIVVSFVGETTSLVQSVDRATRTVSVFQSRMGGLRTDSRKVENALFNLAGAATGLQGPLGKLAEIGLQFAVGGGWAMAIAGGVALAAAAYKALTKASADAASEQSAFQKRLADGAKRFDEFTGKAVLAAESVARFDMLTAKRQVTNLQATFANRAPSAEELSALQQAVLNLQNAEKGLDLASGDVVKWMGEHGPKAETAAQGTQKLAGATSDLAAALERVNLARQRDQRIAAGGGGNQIFPEGTNLADPTQGAAPDFLSGGGRTFGEGSRLGEVGEQMAAMGQRTASAFQQAWQSAAFVVQQTLADTFMSLFQTGQSFAGRLQNLLNGLLASLAQIASQLLARSIVGAIGNAVGGAVGGGASFDVSGGGLALRQGAPVTVTNVFNVSALDARGVQDVILENYGAVTAATMRGLSESRMASMSLGIR
jgi:hypothetical protein